jgi:Zn-dependent membrane protease YugP
MNKDPTPKTSPDKKRMLREIEQEFEQLSHATINVQTHQVGGLDLQTVKKFKDLRMRLRDLKQACVEMERQKPPENDYTE